MWRNILAVIEHHKGNLLVDGLCFSLLISKAGCEKAAPRAGCNHGNRGNYAVPQPPHPKGMSYSPGTSHCAGRELEVHYLYVPNLLFT